MILFKHIKKQFIFHAALIFAIAPAIAEAEVSVVRNAKITRTLNDSNFGGCMVYLDVPIAQEDGSLSSCPSKWLSLDCDAVHHTQAQANAMWTTALMAFTLQKRTIFYVNENVKFNGYCMARRMDVY